jgi:hypothetical protein
MIATARSHKRFKPIDVLGQGTYGKVCLKHIPYDSICISQQYFFQIKVYKAVDLDDPSRPPVAMKKVRSRCSSRLQCHSDARNCALLQRLKHENVVELLEVCSYAHDGLFLVMTCMEIDLLVALLLESQRSSLRRRAQFQVVHASVAARARLLPRQQRRAPRRQVSGARHCRSAARRRGQAGAGRACRRSVARRRLDAARGALSWRTAAPPWRALAASAATAVVRVQFGARTLAQARRLSAPSACDNAVEFVVARAPPTALWSDCASRVKQMTVRGRRALAAAR